MMNIARSAYVIAEIAGESTPCPRQRGISALEYDIFRIPGKNPSSIPHIPPNRISNHLFG
jgi:hypothetical protein